MTIRVDISQFDIFASVTAAIVAAYSLVVFLNLSSTQIYTSKSHGKV